MSSSLNVPPQVPTPHRSSLKGDETEDLFATLFSPPTPPASPIPTSLFDSREPSTSRPIVHSRTASDSSSEFGSFVSVSTFEDPLKSDEQEAFEPLPNLDFFEKFTDGAAKANAQNKKVLEELLEHEDDPLYWLMEDTTSRPNSRTVGNELISSGAATPIPRTSSPSTVASISRQMVGEISESVQIHPSRDRNATKPSVSRTSSPILSRSPTSGSVTSRLLSSFRPSNPVPISFTDSTSVSGFFDPLPHSSSSFHQSAASPSSGTSSTRTPEITHGTPFSSQIYTPPSGAPGFAGDRNWNKSNFEFDETVVKKSVRLTGRKEITTPVLTAELAEIIRPCLPAIRRLATSWSLLYSLDQHGISLNTLYSRCMNHLGSALVVMKDSEEKLFGVWLGETVRLSKGAYYGSGESFLWKLANGTDECAGKLKVFKWTGRNDYVALCEPEYLSFGGGDGKYGVYLDDTLLDGSSAWCPTFANEPLCSGAESRQGGTVEFECVGLEVWGIGGT